MHLVSVLESILLRCVVGLAYLCGIGEVFAVAELLDCLPTPFDILFAFVEGVLLTPEAFDLADLSSDLLAPFDDRRLIDPPGGVWS